MGEMHFRPVPTDTKILWDLRLLWGQFLPRIADRSDETEQELFNLVMSKQVQIGLVLDERGNAHALVGVVRRKVGPEFIGEVLWVTGWGIKEWEPLLSELEQYLKDERCTIIKPICRPGWKRLLTKQGYRQTHVVMEKSLCPADQAQHNLP